MKSTDVIVIGGGPAGCASAILLAESGKRVVLFDRARFPRDKVCGEFISPAADDLLTELNVLTQIESCSPLRLGGVAISAYGGPEVLCPYPAQAGCREPVTSLSFERLQLDQIFIDRAKAVGVEVMEEHHVYDLTLENGQVTGVKVRDPEKHEFEMEAPLVIDAGGRNAISLRKFKLRKDEKGNHKIALAAHWQEARFAQKFCYMHISRPGYSGMSPTAGGGANVVLVVDHRVIKGKNLDEAYRDILMSNARRRKFLKDARPREKVRAIDSLAFRVEPLPVGGLMLVGDAMGFIDPFTGEGIYLALRSARLAVDSALKAFTLGDFTRRVLAEYEDRRHREFNKKFILCRALQFLIANRFLCKKTVSLLERRRDLADALVGVIGDYLPPGKVVSSAFLIKLVMGFFDAEGKGMLSEGCGQNRTPELKQTPASTDIQELE